MGLGLVVMSSVDDEKRMKGESGRRSEIKEVRPSRKTMRMISLIRF